MPSVPVCMAPDPNTRTPKYKPPPGACDAHCHIFGPGDKYPYAPDRSYTPPDAPLAKLQALQKTLGLSRAVLVNASCHGTDNAVILDEMKEAVHRANFVINELLQLSASKELGSRRVDLNGVIEMRDGVSNVFSLHRHRAAG